MKLILTLIIATLLLITSCNKIIEPKNKGLSEITKIEQRWSDGIKVAESTPRIGLSSQVKDLQTIKRDLDAVEVSNCIKEAKVALSKHMELTIDGLIAFMRSEEETSIQLMHEGGEQLSAYRKARDKCSSR